MSARTKRAKANGDEEAARRGGAKAARSARRAAPPGPAPAGAGRRRRRGAPARGAGRPSGARTADPARPRPPGPGDELRPRDRLRLRAGRRDAASLLHVNAWLAKPAAPGVHGLVLPGGLLLRRRPRGGHRARDPAPHAPPRRDAPPRGPGRDRARDLQRLPGAGEDGARCPASTASAERAVALASNDQNRYEDRWVTLEVDDRPERLLASWASLHCPVAHAEGRFLPLTRRSCARLARGRPDRAALRGPGRRRTRPATPGTRTASTDDVAGIIDPTGRILGLMPHPERNQFPWQDPRLPRRRALRASPRASGSSRTPFATEAPGLTGPGSSPRRR